MSSMQNKRKREAHDVAGGRPAPALNQTSNEFEQYHLQTDDNGIDNTDGGLDFAAVVAQHGGDFAHQPDASEMQAQNGDGSGQSASDTAAAAMAQFHTMTVPQSTAESFMNRSTDGGDGRQSNTAGEQQTNSDNRPRNSSFGDFEGSSNEETSPTAANAVLPNTPKPVVGSDEWHKVRRDNHKEVERRRRETINEGINELAKIVPGCEKNKGSILARAVQFITQLKENETQNIEKWTLEKLLTEQAIAELSSSCDKLKAECQRAWAEVEQYKKATQNAGITVDVNKTDADAEDAD